MSDLEIDKNTMEEIRQYLVSKLTSKYGYCGVAHGKDMVMLNSGKTNLIIKMELK